MPKYRVYDIQWDTDGERVDLPTEFTLETEYPVEDYDLHDIEEFFSEEITERTGFCHTGFSYEIG